MTRSANLGFPRIGLNRELKKSLEAYWQGAIDAEALHATGQALRARHWQLQRDAGIEVIPSNDFSFYDHVLDMTATLGAIPPRFAAIADPTERYFAMARGTACGAGDGNDQMVRHQLPLHRARVASRSAVPPCLEQGGG